MEMCNQHFKAQLLKGEPYRGCDGFAAETASFERTIERICQHGTRLHARGDRVEFDNPGQLGSRKRQKRLRRAELTPGTVPGDPLRAPEPKGNIAHPRRKAL